jgi:LysR family transcriptional regulator, transcriptional activator of nhaA
VLGEGALKRLTHFRVGIADVMPKSIVYKLLAPAMSLDIPIKIVCKEGKLDRLLADLAIHRLDLVLSDRPVPPEMNIKAYSHKLVECGLSFFATQQLADKFGQNFPSNLNNAPLLVPSIETSIRKKLMQWLDMKRLHPTIVGEFDDSALMKAFGQAGAGIFMTPSMIAEEVQRQFEVIKIGDIDELVEGFYAISSERRASHPAVIAINNAEIK